MGLIVKELIFTKIVPIRTGFTRNYLLKLWSDGSFELRKMGMGSDLGWTLEGCYNEELQEIQITKAPILTAAHEPNLIEMFKLKVLNRLAQYREDLYVELLEEGSEWSLI